MTQEGKNLLLVDLCARLPYGVKLMYVEDLVIKKESHIITLNNIYLEHIINGDAEIKPYLRSLSSMMQGEWEEMTALIYPYGRVNGNPDNKNELLLWLSAEGNDMPIILMDNVFSWLNEHHFDYRGLIEKGLALEAPENMYRI